MSETILTMDDRLPAPIAQLPNFDEEQLQATPNMTPRIADAAFDGYWPVSYTHLTLPTILLV